MDHSDLPLQEIHPVIAGTDIAAEMAACALFWRRKPLAGLLVRLVPPVVATALMTRGVATASAEQDPPGAGTDPAGAPPVPAIRPTINHGIRVAGDVLLLWGAWRRKTPVILAGAAVVAFGWSVKVVGPGGRESQPAPGDGA